MLPWAPSGVTSEFWARSNYWIPQDVTPKTNKNFIAQWLRRQIRLVHPGVISSTIFEEWGHNSIPSVIPHILHMAHGFVALQCAISDTPQSSVCDQLHFPKSGRQYSLSMIHSESPNQNVFEQHSLPCASGDLGTKNKWISNYSHLQNNTETLEIYRGSYCNSR